MLTSSTSRLWKIDHNTVVFGIHRFFNKRFFKLLPPNLKVQIKGRFWSKRTGKGLLMIKEKHKDSPPQPQEKG